VADLRVTSPSRTVEAGKGATFGEVEAAASPRIIDVDPISARPAGANNLVKDQPQVDQEPRGLRTSGAQVPESSSSIPRLPQWEIDWNDMAWQDDIFEDNEDMQTLWISIVTINHALTVSLLMTFFSW
jgi:hypothetical protein